MARSVNLIADKLLHCEKLKKRAIRAIALSAAIAILGSASICAIRAAAFKASVRLSQIESEIKLCKEQHELFTQLESRAEENLGLSRWASDIRNANQESRAILGELTSRLPKDLFLTDVELLDDENERLLKVSGTALSLEDIATFIWNLSKDGGFGEFVLESTQMGKLNGRPVVNFRCSIAL